MPAHSVKVTHSPNKVTHSFQRSWTKVIAQLRGRLLALGQQALIVDVAAKVLADNLASLVCAAAQATRHADKPVAGSPRRCNRAFAALTPQRMPPPVLQRVGDVT